MGSARVALAAYAQELDPHGAAFLDVQLGPLEQAEPSAFLDTHDAGKRPA